MSRKPDLKLPPFDENNISLYFKRCNIIFQTLGYNSEKTRFTLALQEVPSTDLSTCILFSDKENPYQLYQKYMIQKYKKSSEEEIQILLQNLRCLNSNCPREISSVFYSTLSENLLAPEIPTNVLNSIFLTYLNYNIKMMLTRQEKDELHFSQLVEKCIEIKSNLGLATNSKINNFQQNENSDFRTLSASENNLPFSNPALQTNIGDNDNLYKNIKKIVENVLQKSTDPSVSKTCEKNCQNSVKLCNTNCVQKSKSILACTTTPTFSGRDDDASYARQCTSESVATDDASERNENCLCVQNHIKNNLAFHSNNNVHEGEINNIHLNRPTSLPYPTCGKIYNEHISNNPSMFFSPSQNFSNYGFSTDEPYVASQNYGQLRNLHHVSRPNFGYNHANGNVQYPSGYYPPSRGRFGFNNSFSGGHGCHIPAQHREIRQHVDDRGGSDRNMSEWVHSPSDNTTYQVTSQDEYFTPSNFPNRGFQNNYNYRRSSRPFSRRY